MTSWKHKDTWTRKGKHFAVEITRHSVALEPIGDEGTQRWCVYGYIYPQHPLFAKFEGDSIHQVATQDLPLHCGCTYLRWHRDHDGSVCSVQVGADYNHLHDEQYTHAPTLADSGVERDANQLFDHLAALVKETGR